MSSLILLGDIALNGLYLEKIGHINEAFANVRAIFEDVGFTIANLETPIIVDGILNPLKPIHFYTNEQVVREVFNILKIKVVSLANNHIGDCQAIGVRKTIEVLDEIGVYHTGAGIIPEHLEPILFDLNGKKICFMAYVDSNTNPKIDPNEQILINEFDQKRVVDDLRRFKFMADLVIISIHWGKDYSHFPTQHQEFVSKELISAGANIIMGHHSHTTQPINFDGDNIIFYSLGGLTFGDHFQNGVLKALPVKTKRSSVPILQVGDHFNLKKVYSVIELPGNKIKLDNRNWIKWSQTISSVNKLKGKSRFVGMIVILKEYFIDRIWEYFFGYYKNPYKQLCKMELLSKFRQLMRDLNRK